MKKFMMVLAVLFVSGFIVIGCSDDNANNNEGNTEENTDSVSNDNGEDNNNESTGNENASEDTPRSERHGKDEWGDDEMGLSIGDTGLSDSNVGLAEITLDSVKWEDADDLEEDAEVTQLLSAEITLENKGEETLVPEDVLYSGQLNEKGKEYGSMWDYFEGISEEWDDNLDPGEETSGIIVFNHKDRDEYELIFGVDLEFASNKVSFEFDKDEIES